jgi:hypothetical protein
MLTFAFITGIKAGIPFILFHESQRGESFR